MRFLCAVLRKLLRCRGQILNNQKLILERINTMSLILDHIRDFAARIDTATNAIALRIQGLIEQINEGTVTPEEITALLQPEVDRLTELGRDPETPA
jgi:hypothetical protein